MNIEFIKCHGSGNSFVLVGDPRKKFAMNEQDIPNFAKSICDEIDTDGLLIVQKDEINGADSQMRMFNPDGTEAEMCGNGLRCVARETMEVLGLDKAIISTFNNTYKACKEEEISKGVYTVSIEMGEPIFDPKKIPISDVKDKVIEQIFSTIFGEDLPVSILGMPNPHVVVVVKAGNKFPMELLIKTGELVNNDRTTMFPKGGNVNFIQKLTKSEFFVATYERGAGLTESCGSGMSASSIIACILEEAEFNKEITIFNRGGFVKTVVNKDDYKVKLTGNATYVFTAKTFYNSQTGTINSFDTKLNNEEINAYKVVIEAKVIV